jgi:hypothetical protein
VEDFLDGRRIGRFVLSDMRGESGGQRQRRGVEPVAENALEDENVPLGRIRLRARDIGRRALAFDLMQLPDLRLVLGAVVGRWRRQKFGRIDLRGRNEIGFSRMGQARREQRRRYRKECAVHDHPPKMD